MKKERGRRRRRPKSEKYVPTFFLCYKHCISSFSKVKRKRKKRERERKVRHLIFFFLKEILIQINHLNGEIYVEVTLVLFLLVLKHFGPELNKIRKLNYWNFIMIWYNQTNSQRKGGYLNFLIKLITISIQQKLSNLRIWRYT